MLMLQGHILRNTPQIVPSEILTPPLYGPDFEKLQQHVHSVFILKGWELSTPTACQCYRFSVPSPKSEMLQNLKIECQVLNFRFLVKGACLKVCTNTLKSEKPKPEILLVPHSSDKEDSACTCCTLLYWYRPFNQDILDLLTSYVDYGQQKGIHINLKVKVILPSNVNNITYLYSQRSEISIMWWSS